MDGQIDVSTGTRVTDRTGTNQYKDYKRSVKPTNVAADGCVRHHKLSDDVMHVLPPLVEKILILFYLFVFTKI